MAGKFQSQNRCRLIRLLCVAMAIVLAGLGGCRRNNAINGIDIPRTIPTPTLGAKLTQEQAISLGIDFEQAIYSGNPVTANRFFNVDRFADYVQAGMNMTAGEQEAFRSAVMAELSQKGVMKNVMTEVSAGGEFVFLRALEREDGWRPVFRVSSPTGTLNYFEFVTELNPANGEPRIVNAYAYGSGELLSETVGRFSRRLFDVRPRQSFFGSAGGMGSEAQDELLMLQDILKLTEQGEWQKALQLFDELSEESVERKEYLLLKLQIAMGIFNATGESTLYAETLSRFQQLFPTDTSMLLLGIDYHLQQGEFEQSVACVKEIDKRVGGDPFLWKVEIGIWSSANDFTKAIEALEQAIELYPDDLEFYSNGMVIAAETQDHELWIRMLLKAEDAGGFDPAGLEAEPLFEPFIRDVRFLDWKRRVSEAVPDGLGPEESGNTGLEEKEPADAESLNGETDGGSDFWRRS